MNIKFQDLFSSAMYGTCILYGTFYYVCDITL